MNTPTAVTPPDVDAPKFGYSDEQLAALPTVYAPGLFLQYKTEGTQLDLTLQKWIDAGHIQEPPETAGRGSADSVPTPLDGLLNGEIAKRWVSAFGHACFLTALLRGRMQRESD